ncbi:MAG: MucB/RseB C-terminal domain-containing protein [Porticoccaceae bacterium]
MPARVSPLPKTILILSRVAVRWLAMLAVLALGSTASADNDVDTSQMLGTMAEASRQLDYQGIFTYEYAGVLKSVRATHVVRDGVEYQRWSYLNGPSQEILRHGQAGCPTGFDRAMRDLQPQPVIDYQQLASYYEVHLRGEDRVADQDVWVIHLVPLDPFRYGYVFAIDKRSGLLLQSLLLDGGKRVLERFQYMDVSYGVDRELAEELIAAATERGVTASCAATANGAAGVSGWQVSWLPPGFQLMGREMDGHGVETLLFSDGLSVFSIFFDPHQGGQLPEVQAQRGATVVQLVRIEARGRDHLVSVVGEIPLETAQRVASRIEFAGRE